MPELPSAMLFMKQSNLLMNMIYRLKGTVLLYKWGIGIGKIAVVGY
jgi:hypothetical protein